MLCSSVGRRLLRCPLLSLSFRCRMSSSPTKAAAHVRFSQQTSDDAASDASLQDRVTEALILHARESSSSSPASPQPVPLSGNVRQVSDGDGDDEVEPAEAIYAVLNALLSANHNTAHIEYNQCTNQHCTPHVHTPHCTSQHRRMQPAHSFIHFCMSSLPLLLSLCAIPPHIRPLDLSNHLPHALISLWRLGASSRRLLAYVAFYSTRLEPSREQQSDYPSANGEEEARLEAASRQQPAHQDSAPPDHGDSSSRNSEQRSSQRDKSKAQLVHTIDEKSWRYYLGHRKHFDAYFNFFDAQLHTLIAQHSSTTTNNTTAAEKAQQPAIGALSVAERSAVSILLSRYMPTLLPGGSHSALHPIIHVGWALSCGRAGLSTLCEGLAYMCYSFHSLDNSCGSDYSSAALLAVDGANSQSLFATLQSTVSACREQRLLTAMGESVLRVPYCEMQVGIFQRKLVWLSIHQAQLLHRLSCLPQLPSAPASTLESVLSSLFLHTMFLFAISNDDFFVSHASQQQHNNLTHRLRAADARVSMC